MAEERLRCALPLPVALDERLQRAHQLAAVGALGLLDRGQDRVAEQPQRVVVLQRQQQLEGAEVAVGGERRRRSPLPLTASARASSAQRASWKPRRRSPGATVRPAPAGSGSPALARDARVQPLGEREQLVVAGRGQQRAQEAPGRRDQPAAGLLAHGARERLLGGGARAARAARARARPRARAGRTARAGARAPAPARSPDDERGQHVAGQPALGVVDHAPAQQLERDDRHGLVQRQAVELVQRPGVAGGDQPRLGQRPVAAAGWPRPARHGQRERARREAVGGGDEAAPAAGARALAQLRRQRGSTSAAAGSPGAAREQLAAPVEDQRRAADHRRQLARHALEPALGEHDALEPLVRGERAPQHRVLLVDQVRERLLGDRDERQLVGTSKSGNPCSSAAARSASGTRSCEKPTPKPSPVSPWRDEPRDVLALLASSPSCRPVVSSSSPPDSQGVGSASSEMCTQRTARSSPASPATTSSSSSRSRARNGNIAARA